MKLPTMKLLNIRSTVVLISTIWLVLGCASMDVDSYRDQSPALVLEEFFDGPVKAWGIVQNRKGTVVQRMKVDIDGSFADDELVLNETFEYSLGEGAETRVWKIKRLGNGMYSGSANDIDSEAVGQSFGNAFNWKYQMDLPVGERTYRVQFNDWFWAFDENTIMNKAYIKKFGLVFAEVTLFMQRQ